MVFTFMRVLYRAIANAKRMFGKLRKFQKRVDAEPVMRTLLRLIRKIFPQRILFRLGFVHI